MKFKITNIFMLSLILAGSLFCQTAWAWKHSISLGYGFSHEVGYDYYNKGLFLNAKLYKFPQLDRTLFVTIDGSLAYWHATTRHDNRVYTAALSGAARAYFVPPKQQRFKPYLLFTFGPAYLSRKHFGETSQGSHLSLQTTLGGGSEINIKGHDLDFNLRLIHYCNGGAFRPNQGIDILYVFSIGYLF